MTKNFILSVICHERCKTAVLPGIKNVSVKILKTIFFGYKTANKNMGPEYADDRVAIIINARTASNLPKEINMSMSKI